MSTKRRIRRRIARFILRYRLAWFATTLTLNAAAIPIMIWVYPATTLTLGILIAFSALTSSMGSMADLLVDDQDEDESTT